MTGADDLVRIPPGAPTCMADAHTRSSLLRSGDHDARWAYYHDPVRDCLLRMHCPLQEVDGLTNDLLIRLQTNILLGYDRSKPFRPYLKKAIRNWYVGLLRRRKQVERVPSLAVLDDDQAGTDTVMEDGLIDYARQGYHLFSLEADASLKMGIAMLEAWIIDDVEQSELARHWQLTDRQVRTWLSRTADRLAEWLHGHLHEQDLQDLAQRARAQDHNLALDPHGLRRLFSHLSQQKRANALYILSLIVQRDRLAEGPDGAAPDAIELSRGCDDGGREGRAPARPPVHR